MSVIDITAGGDLLAGPMGTAAFHRRFATPDEVAFFLNLQPVTRETALRMVGFLMDPTMRLSNHHELWAHYLKTL